MNDASLTTKSGSTITWIYQHQNRWRAAILLLLLVAILGPWVYTSDGVPPAEWCEPPYILLESDRCVKLESGVTVFIFMVSVLFSMGPTLASGMIGSGEIFREFLFILFFFLLLLPFYSSLPLFLCRENRRLRLFNMATWGLALVPALLLATTGGSGLPFYFFWGIWLYIILATLALILELLLLQNNRKPQIG
ncbi:MAG: hypothetical protein PVH03_14630 [Chloroflexota bacterium]|jgi:hypothetical protein